MLLKLSEVNVRRLYDSLWDDWYKYPIELKDLRKARKYAEKLTNMSDENLDPQIIAEARQHLLALQEKLSPSQIGQAFKGLTVFILTAGCLLSVHSVSKSNYENVIQQLLMCLFELPFSYLTTNFSMNTAAGFVNYLSSQEFFKDGIISGLSKTTTSLVKNILLPNSIHNQNHKTYVITDISALINCNINILEHSELLDIFKKIYSIKFLQLPENSSQAQL